MSDDKVLLATHTAVMKYLKSVRSLLSPPSADNLKTDPWALSFLFDHAKCDEAADEVFAGLDDAEPFFIRAHVSLSRISGKSETPSLLVGQQVWEARASSWHGAVFSACHSLAIEMNARFSFVTESSANIAIIKKIARQIVKAAAELREWIGDDDGEAEIRCEWELAEALSLLANSAENPPATVGVDATPPPRPKRKPSPKPTEGELATIRMAISEHGCLHNPDALAARGGIAMQRQRYRKALRALEKLGECKGFSK